MARRSSVSPTLTVFGVWWVITAYLSQTYDWNTMVQAATVATFGVVLGVVGAVVSIAVIRTGYRGITAPTELRGLRCSIGEVPMPMPPPPRAEGLPPISPITAPDVPPDFIDNWLDEYGEEFPAHAAIFKALLLVLNHRPELPATHVPGGHGGRTLLQHSLLTAWIMSEVSRTWKYDGLRDRTGKKIVVPLRNKEYRFNPHDPMVAIIGLAHDIGKIEAFIYNDRGDVVGIRSEHDLTGSRMIARMPEAWDIPSHDRDAMLLAIAHYHHPVELPMAPDQRKAVARDDRTIALMELLIRADFTVSRVENDGRIPTDDEYQSLDSVRSVSPEQLYDEFVALIHESHRINSGNIKYSVGQISPAPDGKNGLLYLHEESLRTHMMRRLSLQTTEHLGNGRYQITVDLLNVLKARGVLYTIHENLEYSPGNAMWVCDVLGAKGQKVADWPCAIALKLDGFEKLQQLGFFSSSIKIVRNRFGAHMGKQVKEGPGDTLVLGGLGSSNDIPEAPESKKKAKTVRGPRNATKQNQPTSTKPEAPPVPSPAVPIAPSSPQEVTQSAPVTPASPIMAPVPEDTPQDETNEAKSDGIGKIVPVVSDASKDCEVVLAEPNQSVVPVPTPADPQSSAESKATGVSKHAQLDAETIKAALMLAVDLGRAGKIKCRQGDSGNFVFNLEALLSPESTVEAILSRPGVIDMLSSGTIKGVGVTRIKTMTLISVTIPLSVS